jgi:DNA repair protein RadD
MIQYRPYQRDLRDALRASFAAGNRRVLAVSPTGSGKTVLFALTAKAAVERGLKGCVVAHRQEIIDQISRTLLDVGVDHGFCVSGLPTLRGKPATVASIQTLSRRVAMVDQPDLVILDEAHHAVSATYTGVMAQWNTSKVLGVTATPERLDGKGLRSAFDDMVLGPSVQWLIDEGFLARPVYYAPGTMPDLSAVRKTAGDFNKADLAAVVDKPTITGDAVAHYRRIVAPRPAVAFCVSVAHAENVASRFREAGVAAMSIDGSMDPARRREIVGSLRDGKLGVMTSCELVSEGFDLPAVGGAILLRPTASLSMHLQQVGRALRPSPGKSEAVILDHVGNCLRHGLAEDAREWSLDGRPARKKGEATINVKQCGGCFNVFRGETCQRCGQKAKAEAKEIEEKDGELVRMSPEKLAEIHEKRREEWSCKTLADWMNLARKRGYKAGWAFHRFQARGAR